MTSSVAQVVFLLLSLQHQGALGMPHPAYDQSAADRPEREGRLMAHRPHYDNTVVASDNVKSPEDREILHIGNSGWTLHVGYDENNSVDTPADPAAAISVDPAAAISADPAISTFDLLPDFEWPQLPQFPSFPSFSSLPSLPSLPSFADLPKPQLPSLPSFPGFSSFPTVPGLSTFSNKIGIAQGVPEPQTQMLIVRYPDIASGLQFITEPLTRIFTGFTNGINNLAAIWSA